MIMTVTFCGHSNLYDSDGTIGAKLVEVLEQLVAEGADQFYLGGYGSFDALAAKTVKDLQKAHPQIHSTLVLPYLNRQYNEKLYDDTTYPPLEEVPRRYAISRRNEWMVDQADVVVSYVDHGWGGAAKTLEYAQRKKKRIISVIPK